MTFKKALIIFELFGLILLGGLYAKRKLYDPKHQLYNSKNEVKQLGDNHEIRNGDLIFQTSLSRQSNSISYKFKIFPLWTCL